MDIPAASQSGEGESAAGFHPVRGADARVPRNALRLTYSRSSGPGGQNVNKVNTRAEVRITIADIEGLSAAARARLRTLAGSRLTREDEIVIVCDSSRSQRMNREETIERLLDLIAAAAREPKVRKKKRISRAAKAKRVESKRRQTKKKEQRRWREE